eukprot:6275715-Prymnesium_polylepis.1
MVSRPPEWWGERPNAGRQYHAVASTPTRASSPPTPPTPPCDAHAPVATRSSSGAMPSGGGAFCGAPAGWSRPPEWWAGERATPAAAVTPPTPVHAGSQPTPPVSPCNAHAPTATRSSSGATPSSGGASCGAPAGWSRPP